MDFLSPVGTKPKENSAFLMICLDGIHQTFVSNGLTEEIQPSVVNYFHEKHRLNRDYRKNLVLPIVSLLNISYFDQDWMDFHRLSRAKKPGFPIDSIETEGIYAAWLMLTANIRSLAKDYLIRGVDPFCSLLPILQIYLEFFNHIYETFTTNPVSVQRTETFTNDLKLFIGLIEQVFSLLSNVKSSPTAEGITIFKVKWSSRCAADSAEIVILYKNLQLIKSHLKVLFKILTLTHNNIDESLSELQSGLYKNRKLLAIFPEIYKKAYEILDFFEKEDKNLQSLMQEIGQPVHTETPLSDTPRNLDVHGSSSSIRRQLVSQKSGDMFNVVDSPEIANELFQQNVAFDVVLEITNDTEDPWMIKVDKFLRELTEEPPKMLDEFLNLCKLSKKEVILSKEESDMVSYSKKRDFFLFRPELLDKDTELSNTALTIKNKVKKIF